jgi:hypothetical protein
MLISLLSSCQNGKKKKEKRTYFVPEEHTL